MGVTNLIDNLCMSYNRDNGGEQMKFTLNNDTLLVEIDTNGGYINWLLFEGQAVFYEKTQLDYDGKMKDPGGSHLCYPQFSNAANGGLG